jgi:hypothetical protein
MSRPSTTGASASAPGNALSLAWTFGLNKDTLNGVHNLSTEQRNAVSKQS